MDLDDLADADPHRVWGLSNVPFMSTACFAAESIERYGSAYVDLQPGDGTAYQITIVQPPTNQQWKRWSWYKRQDPPRIDDMLKRGDAYFVATQFGPMYRWTGDEIGDWGYVHEKWLSGQRLADEHTARVLFRFLNTLSPLLPDNRSVGD